ncbi:hypothetical protein B5M42_004130 [Paenibacillus athensensis]|uniref:Uncharacterized protein n=1 Tax=Paenibacillus athensensis TaxID=1967502 RepID=A0A4Y8PY33_9BACL|nr:hypothetical protein [Paenibacillus athensensis]MCD1258025.1 hypothetical protein [Paenibacillus athensensis]
MGKQEHVNKAVSAGPESAERTSETEALTERSEAAAGRMGVGTAISGLQRQLGNNGVAQLVRSQSGRFAASSAPVGAIQRVSDNKDHHIDFLTLRAQAAGADLSQAPFMLAHACAYVMDHHLYKEKFKPGNLPPVYLPVQGLVPQSGDPEDYHKIIYDYIGTLGGAATSQVKWGGLTAAGTGTGARITYAPNGHAEGTPTDAKTPWMTELSKRKDGTKGLYVMGHLINADLGGPGLDYNYVPLTGRAGWHGANDANALHSKGIEQIVKTKYAQLGGDVTALEYEVVADYSRGPRTAQTDPMQQALQKIAEIEGELGPLANTQLARLEQADKEKLKKLIQAVPNLDTMLYAVSSGNYWTRNWATLKGLVQENLNLWQYEDQIVPSELNARVTWTQAGSQQELRLDVPIILPDSLATPYNSNRESNYKSEAPMDHKSQFADYLERNSGAYQLGDEASTKAKGAALLMDLNEYDRENLTNVLANMSKYYDIQHQIDGGNGPLAPEKIAELQAEQAEYVDAFELIKDEPDIAKLITNKDTAVVVANLLSSSSGALFNEVQDYTKQVNETAGTGKKFSQFAYSGQTPFGSPSKIVAQLEKDGHPQGSSAGGDPAWMLQLEERRDASKTLYVRGHMLNRHLGGAGLDSNMVPLTGREGWYGANNANGMHSAGIEENVKHLYEQVAGPGEEADPSKVTNLVYTVEAIFGDHARQQTAQVKALYTAYKQQVIDGVFSKLAEGNEAMDDNDHKEKYTNYSTGDFINMVNTDMNAARDMFLNKIYVVMGANYPANQDPTVDPLRSQIAADYQLDTLTVPQLIQAWKEHLATREYQATNRQVASQQMAMADMREQFSLPIGALQPAQVQFIQGVVQANDQMEAALNAVSPNGNYLLEDIRSLQDGLYTNSALWEFEDKNVPLRLEASVRWTQHGMNKYGEALIPVVLPSDLKAPYRERELG